MPSHISKVSVPTWSTVNGQDDIKWYQATKVGANTYSAKIPLTNHGFDFGTYSAHVYGTNSQTGQSQSLTGTDFQVSDIQGLENPQVTLSNSQSSQGTFTVSVLETALAKKVTGLTVTASQTSNPALTKSYSYKPYTYGRISGQVDLKQISNQTADYSVTALVTYSDQTSTTFTLTNQAYRPVLADTTVVPTPPSTTAPAPKITTYINETNTYPVGQCTWGVKVLAPWIPNWLGNARDWTANAAAKGFRTGTTPAVGAVAVWPNDGGGYGHVAYVTAVESSTRIQVKESNYAGNMTINNYRGWFNPATGPVYYIYPN